MTTPIEIIDTAVKIGLGALISGIATYMVTKRNHAHEIKNGIATDKKELLLGLIHKLDSALSKRNSSTQSIWRKIGSESADLESEYADLTHAANEVKLAISYAFLIDRKDIAGLLSNIFYSIEEERKFLESGGRDLTFINQHSGKRSQLLHDIRELLPNALERLHA